ncbi:tlde1 domain-containing protein [Vreelandella sp. F11]|uniref:tlde1 domain-containing protein n=1 Tax=Vreelandella sp. F11 TaxID=3394751 RepID=UPI0036DECE16
MDDTELQLIDTELLAEIGELVTTSNKNTQPVEIVAEHVIRFEFHISIGKLFIVTPSFSMTIDATTGNGECLNNSSIECQRAAWEGPLPVGSYEIREEDLSDPGLLKGAYRNLRHGDWGDWRIRLYPQEEVEFDLYGRDNFFLHGGSLPGSAGCIDIGGGLLGDKDTDTVKTIIRMSKEAIPVEVLP